MRLAVALVVGAMIAAVDNFAFDGEASPIVIVVMLLTAAAIVSAIWGRRGWMAVGVMWACVPTAHLVKHVLGLPDTLHPNTYTSILYLAVFTLCVAMVGAGFGLLTRKLARSGRHTNP